MKNEKKIFNSIMILIISQIIVKIFGLIYKLYLANKQGFGDSGNAIYNSGYQIYALLLTISSIGVPNAVAKLVAEKRITGNREEVARILKSSLIIFSIIGLICTVLLTIFSGYIAENLLSIPEAKYTIIALSPAIFNVCLISVFRGYYNGINKIKITANSQTIEQLLKTIFTIVLVEIAFYITNKNTVIMAAVANFATTLATLFGFVYLYNKNDLKMTKAKFEIKSVKKILKISIPISLSAILASLNRNIDSVTIVRFLKENIGETTAKIQYGILSGKIDVLSALPVSFIIAVATTIVPTIASLSIQKNKNNLKRISKTYILFTILIAIPCCFGMIFFSNQILYLLFNSNSGSILLKISAISIIFISLEQIINAILQGIGKVFIPAVSLLIGVIIKIILNNILIKLPSDIYFYGGINGACIATVICHLVAFTISFKIMQKRLDINLEICKYVLKPVLSSCIMALCLYSAYFLLKCILIEKIAILLSIIVAGFMYIAMIFILKTLNEDEIMLIPILPKIIEFFNKNKIYKKKKEKRRILHKFGE